MHTQGTGASVQAAETGAKNKGSSTTPLNVEAD